MAISRIHGQVTILIPGLTHIVMVLHYISSVGDGLLFNTLIHIFLFVLVTAHALIHTSMRGSRGGGGGSGAPLKNHKKYIFF